MNEETIQYKFSMPLINDEELQRIDNYYNELVDEFLKKYVKEKDNIIAQRIMMNLKKENKQLKEQLKVIKKTTNELLTYLDKNKLVLNNPNISDFYINIKEILKMDQGE